MLKILSLTDLLTDHVRFETPVENRRLTRTASPVQEYHFTTCREMSVRLLRLTGLGSNRYLIDYLSKTCYAPTGLL